MYTYVNMYIRCVRSCLSEYEEIREHMSRHEKRIHINKNIYICVFMDIALYRIAKIHNMSIYIYIYTYHSIHISIGMDIHKYKCIYIYIYTHVDT